MKSDQNFIDVCYADSAKKNEFVSQNKALEKIPLESIGRDKIVKFDFTEKFLQLEGSARICQKEDKSLRRVR
jgi:hypothetical protein